MSVKMGLASDLTFMQWLEIQGTATTLRSLIEFEWNCGDPRSVCYITMVRNFEYALAVMCLVPEGSTGIQNAVYILPPLN